MQKIEIGSQEWLDLRRNYITATDACAIMGVGFDTPLQLYHIKQSGKQKEKNEFMQRGIDLEPMARLIFEEQTGYMVSPQWRVHPSIKWMAATFDGINDEGVIVEIKCPGEKDHILACQGKVPEKYYPQCQHQMKVNEEDMIQFHRDYMYYFSYRPEYYIAWAIVKVPMDHVYIANMIDAEKEFADCLKYKTPPKPSARDVVLLENRSWLMNEEALYSIRQKRKQLDEEEERIKLNMIDMCQGQASRGYRLKLAPVEVEGRIDYQSIPSIKEMNLEEFRKPKTIQWRIYDLHND